MTASHYAPGNAHHEFGLHTHETHAPVMPLPIDTWPVPGLLAPGVALLTGPASSGKSWFAQQLAFSICDGDNFLGHFSTHQGETLYLSFLGDTQRLLERAHLLRNGRPLPVGYRFSTTWKPKSEQSPIAPLRDFLYAHPNTRLIVIDHLTALQSYLATAYADPLLLLQELKTLAREHRVLILLLDRSRPKAFSSQCDSHIHFQPLLPSLDLVAMQLNSQEADAQLHHLSFERSSRRPMLADPADAIASLRPSPLPYLSPERHAILDLLYTATEALTPADIAARLNKDENAVRQLLFKLCRARLIIRPSYGLYSLSPLSRRFIQQSPNATIQHTLTDDVNLAHSILTISKTEDAPTLSPLPDTYAELALTAHINLDNTNNIATQNSITTNNTATQSSTTSGNTESTIASKAPRARQTQRTLTRLAKTSQPPQPAQRNSKPRHVHNRRGGKFLKS